MFTSDPSAFSTRSVWYDDGKEVTVVDAQFTPQIAKSLLADIRSKTTSPVTRVIVTHPGPDKFNGLSAFHAPGIESIASEKTAADMPGVDNYKRFVMIELAKMSTDDTYPQTWWCWRHVRGPLAAAGLRVIAPDYRGAGSFSKPPGGFDRRTMAADIAELLRDALKTDLPVTVVGNDIGMMVAYAFRSEFPEHVKRLVLMEAVLSGSAAYDRTVATSKLIGAPMWHFFFHNAGDGLAEMLTAGRERLYLHHFTIVTHSILKL